MDPWGRELVGFRPGYQMIDHILTMQAIIEEARCLSSKVFYYFIKFQNAFDLVLREAMFQGLREIGASKILIAIVM